MFSKLLVFVLLCVYSDAYRCKNITDCKNCVDQSQCVYIKTTQGFFECINKNKLLKAQPVAVYRTTKRCSKLQVNASVLRSLNVTQDSLKVTSTLGLNSSQEFNVTSKPVRPKELQMKNQDVHPFALERENTVKIAARKIHVNIEPLKIWMIPGKNYTAINTKIIASLCKLEEAFRDFGDVRLLTIPGMEEIHWVRLQIVNPVSRRYKVFCK